MESKDARIQDVCAWLSKAELDLRAAAHEISAPEEGLWGDVMFHAQQATEKAMKAFLVWHDVPFRKTHHLESSDGSAWPWTSHWKHTPIKRSH